MCTCVVFRPQEDSNDDAASSIAETVVEAGGGSGSGNSNKSNSSSNNKGGVLVGTAVDSASVASFTLGSASTPKIVKKSGEDFCIRGFQLFLSATHCNTYIPVYVCMRSAALLCHHMTLSRDPPRTRRDFPEPDETF